MQKMNKDKEYASNRHLVRIFVDTKCNKSGNMLQTCTAATASHPATFWSMAQHVNVSMTMVSDWCNALVKVFTAF